MSENSIGILKNYIDTALKYIFLDQYEESKPSKKNITDLLYNNNIDDIHNTEDYVCKTFKKIQLLFDTIANLLKYKILQIDDEFYQNVEYEKLKYINDEDQLILLLGCYSKAFNRDIEYSMYNIINLPFYSDFINISKIHNSMIPYVADGSINIEKLNIDYNEFSSIIRDFACDVLNINTKFTTDTFIDVDQNIV